MNQKGTRNTNGEGSIYNVVQKIKRKNKLSFECDICKSCTDRKICNNRNDTIKCKRCQECTECLKKGFCDKFYIYQRYQAQITVDGKQTTIANGLKKKDAVDKKIEAEARIHTNSYVKKNGLTIIEVIKKIDKIKLEAGKIGANTQSKNEYQYVYIENWEAFNKPVQKVTYQEVQDFLNSIKHLSQGEIEKIQGKLKLGFMQCVMDKIIAYPDNPMFRIYTPISEQIKEPVQAFELDEQKKLMEYILTKPLIKNSRCNYDELTLRNLFICSLLSAARIGELGAIDIDKQIDLKNGYLKINRTLTLNDSKVTMGKNTKTGKKKIEKGLVDEHYIPFDIFDKELMNNTIKQQIENAKQNPKNKHNLLFCQLDGNYIDHRCVNNIFKRICREAGVKNELAKGCHMHMCRHTGATRMIEAGMDLLVIASILGHSDDRQIKETYGHILTKYINRQLKNSRSYYKKYIAV